MRGTVLVVAGSPDRRAALVDALPADASSTTAQGGLDALKRLRDRPVDCLVAAAVLPDGPVSRFIDRVHEAAPGLPVVLVGEPPESDDGPGPADRAAVTRVESTDALGLAVERVVFERAADLALDDHERLRDAFIGLLEDLVVASSRDEVDRAVFDRLVDTELYRTVWVGEYDPGAEELSLRVPAAGLVDASSLAADRANSLLDRLEGATVVAATQDEAGASAGATTDGATDAAGGPSRPIQRTAAVPFVHDDGRHGLAVLSTGRPQAFDGAERALLDRLGAAVGRVLARLDREDESVAEFAGDLLHELRNPVGAARAHLDIARTSGEEDAFDHIEAALDRLEDLVENLSALAELDAPGDGRRCDLETIVDEAWEPIDAPAAELAVEDGAAVRGDPDLLDLLFSNLLRNAVEHGGDEVEIRVGTVDSGFYVEDDGPGVAPSRRQRVFQRGFSGDDGGLGIGLHLVRKVADAHGWAVDVEEGRSGGARFVVSGAELVDD